jgi:hypothetical protein
LSRRNGVFESIPNQLDFYTPFTQELCSQALLLQQSEQQMFGADMRYAQAHSFLLC